MRNDKNATKITKLGQIKLSLNTFTTNKAKLCPKGVAEPNDK